MKPSFPGCTQRANARASACTAPTVSARTRSSISSCSAGVPATTPPATPRRRSFRRSRTSPTRACSTSSTASSGARPVTTPPTSKELQDNMFDLAFVVRSDEGLTKMQSILGGLRERYDRVAITDKSALYNTDLMETVEVGYLLDCADALVGSALARTESRGGHYREDHPLRDDANWLKHSLAYRNDDGSIRLDYKPVKMGPYIPMERKY